LHLEGLAVRPHKKLVRNLLLVQADFEVLVDGPKMPQGPHVARWREIQIKRNREAALVT